MSALIKNIYIELNFTFEFVSNEKWLILQIKILIYEESVTLFVDVLFVNGFFAE